MTQYQNALAAIRADPQAPTDAAAIVAVVHGVDRQLGGLITKAAGKSGQQLAPPIFAKTQGRYLSKYLGDPATPFEKIQAARYQSLESKPHSTDYVVWIGAAVNKTEYASLATQNSSQLGVSLHWILDVYLYAREDWQRLQRAVDALARQVSAG